jgi:hypothetical protein
MQLHAPVGPDRKQLVRRGPYEQNVARAYAIVVERSRSSPALA